MWDQFVTTLPHYTELGKVLGSDNLQLEVTICFLSQAVVIYMEKKKILFLLCFVLQNNLTPALLQATQNGDIEGQIFEGISVAAVLTYIIPTFSYSEGSMSSQPKGKFINSVTRSLDLVFT